MAIDRNDVDERSARIGLMIEEYEAAKKGRLLQRAMGLWRKAAARQPPSTFLPPKRVH